MARNQDNQRRNLAIAGAAVALAAAALVAAIGCGTMSDSSPSATADGITNNQEQGVDEGGIVKAHGEHLIVLRRGRLFTVRLADRDLTPVCMVDAHPPGSEAGTWYDEMLVHDRTVVVVGYSVRASATEIGLFDLDGQGCISHRSTHFLHSQDYYSSRNYASRLVDGKLVFYMPHHLGHYDIEQGHMVTTGTLPSLRRHGGPDEWEPVLTMSHIHVPVTPRGRATLHTVVACDLASKELSCLGQGIVGGPGRTFYVSPRAVYVWVHDGGHASEDGAPASVFRLPLGGGPPGALGAWGVPTDQFSFREGADGSLDVLLRDQGHGDAMGGPEFGSGGVALARFPAGAFGEVGLHTVDRAVYTPLPSPEDRRPLQNRFVGDHVLYGTGNTWGRAPSGSRAKLFAHPLSRQAPTRPIDLPHGVDRIEALGRDAVVVGTDGDDLHFSSVSLEDGAAVVDRFVRRDAMQGETRSHGFFFRPESEGRGMLGLPIRRQGSGWFQLRQGSAEILYLQVDQLRFGPLGALGSRDDDVDDDCQVSCVDWYGNARPVFYRERVFALLGYELVEGVVRRGRIVEVDRAHLFADMPR